MAPRRGPGFRLAGELFNPAVYFILKKRKKGFFEGLVVGDGFLFGIGLSAEHFPVILCNLRFAVGVHCLRLVHNSKVLRVYLVCWYKGTNTILNIQIILSKSCKKF